MSKPLYTIVITCRNGAATLGSTLKIVVRQAFREWECLVVDNGSVDASATPVQVLIMPDSRFRLQQRRIGILIFATM